MYKFNILLTDLTSQFPPRLAAFMIHGVLLETQAEAGTMAMQKIPKKGCSGPLEDSLFLAGIRLIASVAVRRVLINAIVDTFCRIN